MWREAAVSEKSQSRSMQWHVVVGFRNLIRGWIHRHVLIPISQIYCCYFRPDLIQEGIFSLPFNLVLKSSPHARESEGIAMSIPHSMGVPVPRFILYGEHSPNTRSRKGSIFMTRIPGKMLQDVIKSLSPEELHTIMQELSEIPDCMQSYSNPWGTRIYGVDGKDIYGGHVSGHHIRACDDEHSFYATLLRAAGARDDDKEGLANPNNIVFTHGDLWDHNIMVDHGHISGIYTSILRWIGLQVPWTKQLASLPGYKYSKELEYDLALIAVSDSSFPI
ncbi:uncharacterized protein EV420DRAFT_1695052 [Desarmillaria tabescens]|uniref:Aminoglycoside phosphotransferase domain-containing protein n=1 Tax=Armillaria tabescens TaxID=1929756 RepID=A0AA39K6B0_ARMTA|nr:uncharacterized protein EV420DRAFT_1695052 [Desarmillaria tabescens]KAK0455361.1 hypothetical protein EV420DRAFT_1695052 [Desarmillaria tabescens]